MPASSRPPELPQDELRRRLIAARTLRKLDQKALNAACADLGLGVQEAGRVERGTLPFQPKHHLIFCRVLRLPDRWFTEPNVDAIVGTPAAMDVDVEAEMYDLLTVWVEEGVKELGPDAPTDPDELLHELTKSSRRRKAWLLAAQEAADARARGAAGGTRGEEGASSESAQAPAADERRSGRRRAQ